MIRSETLVLTLEPGDEVREQHCEGCGAVHRFAFGFVYRDDDAYATYNVLLLAQHPDRRALLQVVIGDDWSDEGDPSQRVAVALRIKPIEGGLGATVVDANETPWSGVVLGTRVLDRDEALNNPKLTEVFHVVDHITEEDPVVSAHFNAGSAPVGLTPFLQGHEAAQ